MNHAVTMKEMKDHEFTALMAVSYCDGENKSIKAVAKDSMVRYENKPHNEIVRQSSSLAIAVAHYNSI